MSPLRFFDALKALEALIEGGPTAASLAEFSELVKQPVLCRHAFGLIQDPRWLQPLAAQGFFASPPPPNRDIEKGTIGFPAWPASQLLARMSSRAPQTVCDLILSMPPTENVVVHADCVEAALAMPPELAAAVGRNENKWIITQSSLFLVLVPVNLGKLIRHLVTGGEREAAFELVRSLFEVLPDPRQDANSKDAPVLPHPRARFDLWQYNKILLGLIPDLVKADRRGTLAVTCDLLDSAIRMSMRQDEDGGSEDYSTIWCRTIGERAETASDLKKTLVSAVWETSTLLSADYDSALKVVSALDDKRWNVFRRIALALLIKFPRKANLAIASRLSDRRLFDSPVEEYRELLRRHFGELSEKRKQLILKWIRVGPDLGGYEKFYEKEWGQPPSPELKERLLKQWRVEHLTPIHKFLNVSWKKRYEAWVGQLESVDPLRSSSITEEMPTFSSMSVAAIVEYLKSRPLPSKGEGEQVWPRDSVCQRLTFSVAESPERFAEKAGLFEGLAARFVTAALQGFEQSLQISERKTLSWEGLVQLCSWTLEQPDAADGLLSLETESSWGQARLTIARLFSTSFGANRSEFPYSLRNAVWPVLEALSKDPDPLPGRESIDSLFDLMNLPLNTVRGNALQAVIKYALWVRSEFDRRPDAHVLASSGFDEMPEVRRVLLERLDPNTEQMLSIRAVYGQWLPWLILLDREWVRRNTHRIFSFSETESRYGQVAWNSYIISCQAYDNVFEILREQYVRAVRDMEPIPAGSSSTPDPNVQLANHLMVFYWRGKFSLDDDLLSSFYSRAWASLREECLDFVGRSLGSAGDVSQTMLDYLRALWTRRRELAELSPKEHAQELAAFGWWFHSGKFENTWAVQELSIALRFVKRADLTFLVIERLAAISQTDTFECLVCLGLLIENDSGGWALSGWEAQYRTILSAGILSTDSVTREFAEDLIHLLGASGYLGVQDLLP